MENKKFAVNTQTLLFEYICLKVKNNLGTSVDEKEFKEFTNELLEYLNTLPIRFDHFLDNEDFKEICINTTGDPKTNYNGKEVIFNGTTVDATYDLISRNIISNVFIKDFLNDYFAKKVALKECTPRYFDSKRVDSETEFLAKKISYYLLDYLMNQYIQLKVSQRKWPKQCDNAYKYILEKNLAPIIELEGSRQEFLNIYINAYKVIGDLLVEKDYFEISTNPERCLAFANFNEIVGPYPCIDLSIYAKKDYVKKNKPLMIVFDRGEVVLREYDYNSAKLEDGTYPYNEMKLEEAPGYIEDMLNSGRVALKLSSNKSKFVS